MLSKCLFCIVLYITECFTLNETTPNSVNGSETSTVTSDPNKDIWIPRVINGIPAQLGEVPYQVSLKKLMIDDIYMTFCGGSIISEQKVLSAAHCFVENVQISISQEGYIGTNMLLNKCAVAGCLLNKDKYTDKNDRAQWRMLASARYPKKFNFPNHDIAVVYVRTPFIYNDYVAPIPIASKNLDYQTTCLASGYGRTSHTQKGAISNILLLAQLELNKQSTCSALLLRYTDNFVCITIQASDVAKGDSGGPLVCKNTNDPNEKDKGVLVGVVSGHSKDRGSFFTRVSKYYNFVTDDFPSGSSSSYYLDTFTPIMLTILYKTFLF
ncbi:plasma kallikrein-like [Spodoptera litura]|uniref:Plasma kallikrein-like n=1 Tax=Spodoptera litura TaxID=69820 RepID=A0A9J7IWN9_SPOLT|nr:plasma kallikrein-like [Spodoptera litura]